jgi:hypothetical protein
MGWFRAVHAKSASSHEIRALPTARRLLLDKLRDVELSLRGIVRGFGLKLGKVTRRGFETRVRETRGVSDSLCKMDSVTVNCDPCQGLHRSGLITLRQRHLRLELRRMLLPDLPHPCYPRPQAILAKLGAGLSLNHLSSFRGPAHCAALVALDCLHFSQILQSDSGPSPLPKSAKSSVRHQVTTSTSLTAVLSLT